ncbi:LTA synthase family protein [Echinicola strongylocentroti]|uniref:LTA synthase family protein n=1 Tax=Echinicola strongylocentroti TaxID=1795355 RepID=A0A2Z4IQH9_9BACT|nr:LTA synthase family protein [Echinicola strongylocentroti]AWW32970.1 LTA synthase family protein [Echinicola strongylocentroti]
MSQKTGIQSTLLDKITRNLIKFWQIGLIFLFLQIILCFWEVLWIGKKHHIAILDHPNILITNLLQSLEWGLYAVGLFFIVQLFLGLVFPKISYFLLKLALSLLVLLQIGLTIYFSQTLVPLGADLYTYSAKDMEETVKTAGMLNLYTLGGLLLSWIIFYLLFSLGRYIKLQQKTALYMPAVAFGLLAILLFSPITTIKGLSGIQTTLAENKSLFLYEESYDYFARAKNIYFDFYLSSISSENSLFQKEYTDTQYPFLHKNNYPDVLGDYFEPFETKPNFVFIIVEGLGKAYSGPEAYLGSWTPFLDSLTGHSLYWKNTLSTTGRTFGVLPGLFGGLPFGDNGFMEATPYPKHQTMLSAMKDNGYQLNYFIGWDKTFDNADQFMQYQQVDNIVDIDDFDKEFKKSPAESNGFSWGYADKENFKNGLRRIPSTKQAQVNIFQTMSSHSPFVIPEQRYYTKKVEALLDQNGYSHPSISLSNYKKELASIMYVDDAIKDFFTSYQNRKDFENTIFIITGDHRLPEIPMSSLIDRFHVPLMIYSPKLKNPKIMAAVTTHFEVPNSILSYLKTNYGVNVPQEVAWRGDVLDTTAQFQSNITHALKRNKYQFVDYLSGQYYLSDDKTYIITDNLNIDPVEDSNVYERLNTAFQQYKNEDTYVMENNTIIP